MSALLGPLRMDNPIQHYAWGSTRALARLRGKLPGTVPEAELWMGAHPRAPSRVTIDGQTLGLDEAIARWPEAMLGGPGELPFLLKVLAVAAPLSVQTHPNAEQARLGHAREQARGLPLDHPTRCYPDPHAKPELIVALTPFRALCGFRPWEEARAALAEVGLHPAGLREATELLVRGGPGVEQALRQSRDPLVRELAAHHPGDPGALFPLLLRARVLQPGQSLFLPAGNLHAYLEGVAVEIMGNSDNVLRGGLTAKHRDPEELLRIVDVDAPAPEVQEADPDGAWPSPGAPFRLHGAQSPVRGPAIVLCTGGSLYLGELRLLSGDSAFLPAAAGPQPLGGSGAGFVARP